jgi:acyl carrier protein
MVAGIDIAELEENPNLRDELMLDSMREMEILARTEAYFGISIDQALLEGARSLDDYCELVMGLLNER